jgi:hypothetical protein
MVHALKQGRCKCEFNSQICRRVTHHKGDASVTDYFNKVKTLMATMAAIGESLKDVEAVAYLLASLDSDYESLVMTMTTRFDLVGLNELCGYLLCHEAHNEKKYKAIQFSTLANQASCGGSSSGAPRGGDDFRWGRGHGNGRGGGHDNNNSRPPCQICKRTNHDASRCYHRFDQSYQPEDHVAAAARVQTASYQVDLNWYADSGATDYITSDLDRLTVKNHYNGTNQVQDANGIGLKISHVGHSLLPGSSRLLHLNHVLYVPSINKNLCFVHKLTYDNNAFMELHPHSFYLKDQISKRVLLQGRSRGGLYPIPIRSWRSSSPVALAATRVISEVWHRRLGHPSQAIVSSVMNKLCVKCQSHDSSVCSACQQAKSHQLPFNDSTRVSTEPLQWVHSDVWGPAIKYVNGYQYYVSFLDDYSHFTWIYLIKHKSDVQSIFLEF